MKPISLFTLPALIVTSGFLFTVALVFIKRKGWLRRPAFSFIRKGMLVLLPLAGLAAGCGHNHGDNHDHQAVETAGSHHHEGDAGPLELNGSEKWEADEHTLSVVEDMKSELSDFAKSGNEDYRVLADSLALHVNSLIAGCTMEGKAHDELHKWLVPVTENIKELKTANESSSDRVKVDKMKETLWAFDDFFERKAN